MIFANVYFVFFFFPIVLAIYYISKEEYRNYILLLASWLFYAYGEPKFVVLMIASSIFNYFIALFIYWGDTRWKKTLLVVSVVGNLSVLFAYKYLNFTISIINSFLKKEISETSIILPIGISFFTFQAMSYVIDVYRNNEVVQKNPFKVFLYIALFPQLIAGPIVRYNTIAKQIDSRSIDLDAFGYGVKRFIIGFAKKIILANNLAVVAEQVFQTTDFSNTAILYSWLGSICYSLQIYYDFSGYSDMAIGLGKMFGFDFEENFNYPYVSKTISEFWRRWHISLSRWFRDYVYIPLGGSRKGKLVQIRNLLVVWLLTGLWHGANYTFIVWGLVYCLLLTVEKFLINIDKCNSIVKRLWMNITLLIVNFEWIIFNSKDLDSARVFIWSMFGGYSTELGRYDANCCMIYREYGIFIFAGLIFATPILPIVESKIENHKLCAKICTYVGPVVYLIVFIWAISFLILGMHNPFIYFNF